MELLGATYLVKKKQNRKRTRMKVEVLKPQTTFQLSFSTTRFALYARETTRHARSAVRARRGLKLERRARTYGALPRTQRTEGTELKGLDTRRLKNIR